MQKRNMLPKGKMRTRNHRTADRIKAAALFALVVLGIGYGMEFLGQTTLVRPEVAAWSPILFGGTLSAWLTGAVKT